MSKDLNPRYFGLGLQEAERKNINTLKGTCVTKGEWTQGTHAHTHVWGKEHARVSVNIGSGDVAKGKADEGHSSQTPRPITHSHLNKI